MINDFCHNELMTNDPGKAKEFYGGLFSWKFEEMKMPDGTVYTMVHPGSGPGGGIMKKPMAEAPTAWITYVQVDNVDSCTTKAQKLGHLP